MKLFFSIILLFLSAISYADTASEIKETVMDNLKHTQSENLVATMNTLHSQSLSYLQTEQTLETIFKNYDVQYELLNYQFVGEDDDYAYAKIKQRTKKINGPAFRNNETETLIVFKKENGSWKIWTQAYLSITYL